MDAGILAEPSLELSLETSTYLVAQHLQLGDDFQIAWAARRALGMDEPVQRQASRATSEE